MAVTGMSEQEAYAQDDKMLFKMMEVNEKLIKLQNSEGDIDTSSLAKSAFQLKQIKNDLLEINEMNNGNDERLNKIYSYLKDSYQTAFEDIKKDVKQYSKENGLSASEKKLVSKIIKSKLTFESHEGKENLEKEKIDRMITEVKKTEAKEKYQKLVNEIGTKLANDANGGIVEKIHHKIAIKEIISSKQLELAIPAIDRIIPQVNDEKIKEKLHAVKDKIQTIQERKSKQTENETFELSRGPQVTTQIPIQFNEFEIDGVILNKVIEDELIGSLNEVQQVYEEFEVQTIESILDEEVISSLDEVVEATEEDDEQLENEKEKQRKESRENKSNNKSSKASLGSGNSDKRNDNANDSKGKSAGKGNGK